MLLILSPAKILDLKPQKITSEYTIPDMLRQTESLIQSVRQLSIDDLAELSDTNRNIARINFDRFYNFTLPFTPENAKQAVMMFNGEVFRGLDAKTLSGDDFSFLQQHLRILSGLYGVLRPLDLIQPYRLEISSKLQVNTSRDLYSFWGDSITQKLNKALELIPTRILINLASNEYFKSINISKLKAKVLHVEFWETKNDRYKPIVIYTKKARGMMVRYITRNRIENIEDIKGFNAGGYWFSPHYSTNDKFVFLR